MKAVRRILVAIKDPAAKAPPALTKGAQLARAMGATLELFHAITEPVLADAWAYRDNGLRRFQRDTKARYAKQLETLAAPLRDKGLKINVATDWDFPAYEAIVRHARKCKADLIVAECHAGRRLAPWLLHLTDWELLRASPVPVLLVKNADPWSAPVVLAALDPAHSFAKPAKLDAVILAAATKFASALKGTVHAMHSFVPIPVGAVPTTGAAPAAFDEIAAAATARAQREFDRTLAPFRVPQNRKHLVQGQPGTAIPRVAKVLGSGLVVMGAVSRSGLKRALIGNTAERVLSDLTSDVLVVKPAKFSSSVARKTKGVHYVGTPEMGFPV